MRILVTGNMGYVGPLVVSALRSRFPHASLVGVDTSFFGHRITNGDPMPEKNVDVQVFADVRDVSVDVLADVDVLIHLAAVSNDPMGKAFEKATMEINCGACLRLTEAARGAGVHHVVLASSCSVYGDAQTDFCDESAALNPLTAYARSKREAEWLIGQLATEDFIITCLRFPTAVGMSPRLRLDLVLNDFVAAALTTGRVEVLSDGTPWRPLIDVEDMARAIEWAAERSVDAGGPFLTVNVGRDDCNYQVRDIADAVAATIPGASVRLSRSAVPDKRSYKVNFDLYGELAPDHLPRVSLEESIRRVAAGLEHMHFSEPDFRNSQYCRLPVLMDLQQRGLIDRDLRWVHA